MDGLRRVTEVLAAMPEAERELVLGLMDGPPRRQGQERASEFRPLPSVCRTGTSVRVTVSGA